MNDEIKFQLKLGDVVLFESSQKSLVELKYSQLDKKTQQLSEIVRTVDNKQILLG